MFPGKNNFVCFSDKNIDLLSTITPFIGFFVVLCKIIFGVQLSWLHKYFLSNIIISNLISLIKICKDWHTWKQLKAVNRFMSSAYQRRPYLRSKMHQWQRINDPVTWITLPVSHYSGPWVIVSILLVHNFVPKYFYKLGTCDPQIFIRKIQGHLTGCVIAAVNST